MRNPTFNERSFVPEVLRVHGADGRHDDRGKQQQVKNHMVTVQNSKAPPEHWEIYKPKETYGHVRALQTLSNGENPPYDNTLRIVEHSGSRASHTEAYKTRKHPGYIRNQFGGYFTS